ncbi:MAG TPA: hypothetical protein VNS63_07290 [Blastocatellia bacterium]|nr:hypothetical protein [Blastocatellia bacterium]
MSALQRYFLAPRAPNTAAGFVEDNFAVVDLRRGRSGFSLSSSAVTELPPGLVTPSFDEPNIQSPDELAAIITQTAEAAGLANKKRWSVALPDAAARTIVVALEETSYNARELSEILGWKIERVIAAPLSELRISRQRITPAAQQARYLVTVANDRVLSQYESVFASVGWNAGMLLPRHLGEAQWLMWDETPGDKILVSGNRSGFTSVIVRNGLPVLVRTCVCDREAQPDEMHRFALYYRDRLNAGGGAVLSRMLATGGVDQIEARRAIADATDSEPLSIDASDFGVDLVGEAIRFDHLAGAAGLATLAWR